MSHYVIRPGDTLSNIAKRFGTTADELARVNHLRSPESIQAGATLEIPGWNGVDGFDTATRPYTVQRGDSLYKIAVRFGTTTDVLARLNGNLNAANLQVGQTLRVPAAAQPPQTARTYTVRAGDSLFTIAAKFGTTGDALAHLNGIRDAGSLQPGQVLRLPDAAEPQAPSGPTAPVGGLSNEPDTQFTFQQLWPTIQRLSARYGADPKIVAGIIKQESTFKNWRVHRDGTGHGLIGLDDHGQLPPFEAWCGERFGRGRSARSIPPEKQIEYLAKNIAEMTQHNRGNGWAAVREWHRGYGPGMWDSKGSAYESLIRGHVRELFG